LQGDRDAFDRAEVSPTRPSRDPASKRSLHSGADDHAGREFHGKLSAAVSETPSAGFALNQSASALADFVVVDAQCHGAFVRAWAGSREIASASVAHD